MAQARLGATQWQMMRSIAVVDLLVILVFSIGTLIAWQSFWLQGVFIVLTRVLAIVFALRAKAMSVRAFYLY